MNNLIKSIAITAAAASMLVTGAASAADTKIGVINMQNIFTQMPEAATLQQGIMAEFKEQTDAVKAMEGDIKYNMEKAKRDEAILSKKEKEDLATNILVQRQEFEGKVRSLQANIERRRNEEQQKLLQRIMGAVDTVSKNEGYDFVLTQQSLAFFKPDADISSKIVEQLTKK